MEPGERRAQILEAAAELFGTKGYHSTSISDIIAKAGIARGTFYLYFENKRAIFEELLDQLMKGIVARIRRVVLGASQPSAKEQMLANIHAVVELLSQRRSLLAILLEGAVGLDVGFNEKLASFYEQAIAMVERSLRLGKTMHLVRDLDTRVAALMAVGALKEILHDALRRGEEAPDARMLAEQALDILSRGLLVEGAQVS
ncbi:MAG: TetR/AcrR family transcriptional regulator [Myxococcota bacterium]|jgi:AcrR family transcriptional regulator|nr:TetR/AcrR family transcriptional regulator [Myxococcota bacterium]